MKNSKSLYKHIESLGLKESYLGHYIAAAYSDCMSDYFEYDLEGCYGKGRHLKFMLPEAIEAKDLEPYLHIIGKYNGFDPKRAAAEITEVFGADAKVFVGREGSVCLYVRPSKNVWLSREKIKLSSDEFSFETDLNMFRMWWD